jgi:hypothetical protein
MFDTNYYKQIMTSDMSKDEHIKCDSCGGDNVQFKTPLVSDDMIVIPFICENGCEYEVVFYKRNNKHVQSANFYSK